MSNPLPGKFSQWKETCLSLQMDYHLRPNTQNEFTIISDRLGKVEIPTGTPKPEDTVLVHEFGDHFSIQPAIVMNIEEFNMKLSRFIQNPSFKAYTKEEWLVAHPIGSQITL